MDFLLRLVLALLGWTLLLLMAPAETLLRAPGYAILMTCLSVMLWDYVIEPAASRRRRRLARATHRPPPVFIPLSAFPDVPATPSLPAMRVPQRPAPMRASRQTDPARRAPRTLYAPTSGVGT